MHCTHTVQQNTVWSSMLGARLRTVAEHNTEVRKEKPIASMRPSNDNTLYRCGSAPPMGAVAAGSKEPKVDCNHEQHHHLKVEEDVVRFIRIMARLQVAEEGVHAQPE